MFAYFYDCALITSHDTFSALTTQEHPVFALITRWVWWVASRSPLRHTVSWISDLTESRNQEKDNGIINNGEGKPG
jgi:hypothetical protein